MALVVSSIIFIVKRAGKQEFTPADKFLALITLILAHVQFVVGLVLYFVSPIVEAALASDNLMANPVHRFYAVEHASVMLIAVVLITVGYSRAKRQVESAKKFKTLGLFYLLGLLVALSRIPWDAWMS